MKKVKGYSVLPGAGWRTYGRLIINYYKDKVYSVYFDGAPNEQLYYIGIASPFNSIGVRKESK